MIGDRKASFVVAGTLLPIFLFFWLVFLSPGASARLGFVKTETFIEIDGVNYGGISEINNLRDLTLGQHKEEAFTRVSLRRDFVTEPSLFYHWWARKSSQNRAQLTHVRVITKTSKGDELTRYELINCKPLSWTFETKGGYHEDIELAVQEVRVY